MKGIPSPTQSRQQQQQQQNHQSLYPQQQQQPLYQHQQLNSPPIQRNNSNQDFLNGDTLTQSLVLSPSSSHRDVETLQKLSIGMAKMIATMERLEQRLNKVEMTTSQILKNQQETLQVPFMSQTEIDKARLVAEQLEQDTNVAKQLQATYNKEIEMRKKTIVTTNNSVILSECPICGVRVNQMDLEVHVDNCLEMLSHDPKKEQEAKKKIEQQNPGFFSRFLKKTKTYETTKVTTTESTAPLLSKSESDHNEMTNFYPNYGFMPPQQQGMSHMPPQHHQQQQQHSQGQFPMMMPMYMQYPQYPTNYSDKN